MNNPKQHLVLKIVLGVAGGIIVAFVAILVIGGLIAQNAAENLADDIETALNDSRKVDVVTLASKITTYQTNNNGRLPETSTDLARYLDANFTDPDGTAYIISLDTLSDGGSKIVTRFDHTIYVMLSGKCNGERAVYSSNRRDYAVLYRLTDNTTYCYSY